MTHEIGVGCAREDYTILKNVYFLYSFVLGVQLHMPRRSFYLYGGGKK